MTEDRDLTSETHPDESVSPVAGLSFRRTDERVHADLTRVNNQLAALERDTARRSVELERAIAQKNRLIGMVAHDLRNPLGVILAYSEFLQEDASSVLEPSHMELLDSVRDTSKLMLTIVEDLLETSRLDSGKLNLRLEPTDLADLAERVVAQQQVIAEPKSIHIELDRDATLRPMLVDPTKITQVLVNLISNAVKYSPSETRVRVRVSAADEQAALIEVEDEGQGIPESELGSLFVPFGTTSVRPTGNELSTGLGLAIVRRIVEGHGGRIDVTSEVGVGTTFSVHLPIRAPRNSADTPSDAAADTTPSPSGEDDASLPAPADRSARVLVAEDSSMNRKILRRLLLQLGCSISLVENGEEALHALDRGDYDVALFDIQMPVLDGLSALRKLRTSDSRNREMPVIAVTASDSDGDRDRFLDAGVAGVVAKPVDRRSLQAALESAVPARFPRTPSPTT